MGNPPFFSYVNKTRIHSGTGAAANLPFELESLGAGKPLLIAEAQSDLAKLVRCFRDSGMTVGMAETVPRQTDPEWVGRLAGVFAAHHCDALVVAGGGAAALSAKALNLWVSSGRQPSTSPDAPTLSDAPLKPLVFVPTAVYDGPECDNRVLINGVAVASPHLTPDLVVIDPVLFHRTAAKSSVAAAVSVLAHAVESYCAEDGNPMSRAYAFTAIRLVRNHVLRVAVEKKDAGGRLALTNAAVMTGGALSNTGPGVAARLGRQTSTRCGLPEGVCAGLLLPYALEYQMLKEGDRFSDLLLPLAGPDAYAEAADNLRGPIAVNIIYALLYDLNKATQGHIPLNLKAAGIAEAHLADIADKAGETGLPSRIDPNGCRTILHHAWNGQPIISL